MGHFYMSNRARGQRGEREACQVLNDEFGTAVKRNLGQEREGGTDIHLGPFAIEVKRRRKIAGVYDWLDQAAQAESKYPVAMVRADDKPWVVVMDFTTFARLARGEL